MQDGIAFTLPAGYIPAKTLYPAVTGSPTDTFFSAGPNGITDGTTTLPPGTVYSHSAVVLDGVTFDPSGSNVVIAKMTASGQARGLLKGGPLTGG